MSSPSEPFLGGAQKPTQLPSSRGTPTPGQMALPSSCQKSGHMAQTSLKGDHHGWGNSIKGSTPRGWSGSMQKRTHKDVSSSLQARNRIRQRRIPATYRQEQRLHYIFKNHAYALKSTRVPTTWAKHSARRCYSRGNIRPHIHTKTCIQMFIQAWCVIAKNWQKKKKVH